MIHYFRVSNFGPIKDEVELNFEALKRFDEDGKDAYVRKMPDGTRLLKLAYIYGPNASGKTKVLEALDFLFNLVKDPLSKKDEKIDYTPFMFRGNPEEIKSHFELAFYTNGVRYEWEIELKKEHILHETMNYYPKERRALLFKRETDVENDYSSIKFGSKVKPPKRTIELLESHIIENVSVLGAFAKTNVDIPKLKILSYYFHDFCTPILTKQSILQAWSKKLAYQNDSVKSSIEAYLNKADPMIWSFDIEEEKKDMPKELVSSILENENTPEHVKRKVKNDPFFKSYNIEFKHQVKDENGQTKRYSLAFEEQSEGTGRYFGLAAVLHKLIHEEHFFPIDELESSLHPDLVNHFISTYLFNSENKSQLVFTTHNQVLLKDHMLIRPDALWFTEKLDDGSVDLFSLADFSTQDVRKDTNIFQAYQRGKLGARPRLGSPFIEK